MSDETSVELLKEIRDLSREQVEYMKRSEVRHIENIKSTEAHNKEALSYVRTYRKLLPTFLVVLGVLMFVWLFLR